MTSHDRPMNVSDQVASYLAGAMTPEEREAFEATVRAGDGAAAAGLAGLQDVVDALAEAGAEPPDRSVREAVLAGLDETAEVKVWNHWESAAGGDQLYTLLAHEGGWEETGVDGVLVRQLYVDREANRMTAMFRMAPGTEYVPHRHDGHEECFVLEGDLQVGDLLMKAGDYQRAPAGSHHGVQRTERGCLLLVSCSLDDEWE